MVRMPPPSMPSQAKPKASNSAGSSKSRPPRSVSELGEVADSYKLSPNQHSVKKWCSSASTIFEKASEFRLLHKDDEEAYILLLRGVSIVFQLIPKHPDFSSPDRTYRELEKEALESMETLEKLKISLTQRYDQWKAAQEETAAAAASAKKAEKRSVAIVGPSSAAEVGPAAIDFKFHSNNDPSFGRNTASPPLNNNSSTFNSPLQLAPFRPADIPMEPALTLNAPPSSVPDAHEVARESPRIPVSSPEPPPSPALHYDRSMTCPELHAGLAQVIEGLLASSVLILDVRPLENYIQGHMKWRRLRNNPKATFEMGSIFTSLVHIEPDWITTGVNTEYIELCLRSFTQTGDPRRETFKNRYNADFIILYDDDSNSFEDSAVLTNLLLALQEDARGKGKPCSPALLKAGFSEWQRFIREAGLLITDWVEIGDSLSGEDWVDFGTPQAQLVLKKPFTNLNLPAPTFHALPTAGNALPQNFTYHNPDQFPQLNGAQHNGIPKFASTETAPQAPRTPGYSGTSTLESNSPLIAGPYILTATPSYPHIGSTMYRSSSNPGLYSHTSNFSDYPKLKSNVSGEPKPPPKVWLNSGEPSTAHAYKPAGPRSAEVNVYRHSPANPLNLDQSFNTKLNQLTDLRPSIAGGLPTAPPVRTDSVTLSPSIAIRRKPPPPIPPKPVPTVSRDDSIISPIASTPGNGDFFSLSELGSVSIGVTGLKNLGNSCYMNSTVQCLSGTEYLSRFFNGGSYRRFVNRSNPMGTKGAVAEEYARLVRDMWGGQSPFLVPSQFKNTIGQFSSQFQGHDQHDSQEFLAFLMDAIHEDLNVARRSTAIKIEEPKDDEETPDKIRQEMAWNYYRASNWSIIVDLFQGQLKSKLQCMTCMKTSTTFNPFMYLSLPIPSVGGRAVSLQDCLSKFVEPEILEGEDAWFCPSCKAKRRTKKTLSIAKLPSILLVHLKRFYFQGPFKDKVETYVDFPVDGLDVSGFMPTYMTDVGGRKERFVYDLYAISNHMGTLTSGHYTAQVYNGTRKQWHLFDDSRISSCDEASLKTKSAYILFYHRRRGTSSSGLTSFDWWKNSDSRM